MNFEELLKRQQSASSIESIQKSAKEAFETGYQSDERFWRPTLDKAGNSISLIRFLPAPDTEVPWVKYFTHGFQGPSGRWYIENCPSGIKQPCPVCESNSKLWSTGLDSDKEIARKRKRRTHYVSNILILKDPANPDNNGKVFLYKYGAKIFEKVLEKVNPTFGDEEPTDPFNLFSGSNFKLKVRQVDGYHNYDLSEFESNRSSVYEGDQTRLKELFSNLYPIGEFVDPKEYKPYDALEKSLKLVLSTVSQSESSSEYSGLGKVESGKEFKQQQEPVKNNSDINEDEDDMAYFQKLASSL